MKKNWTENLNRKSEEKYSNRKSERNNAGGKEYYILKKKLDKDKE